MSNLIPGDSKQHRKQIFLQLSKPDIKTGYIDGSTDYCLLIPFAEYQGLSQESKLWLAFLYSLSYSCTTAMRLFLEFPDIKGINPKKLKLYWKNNKDSLWFNPDRKYLKNMNQVVEAIKCFYQMQSAAGGVQSYLIPLLNKGFDETYCHILKHWKFFGSMGAYLFFDAVYGLTPELYTDPTNLDWQHSGQTVVEGMAHLLYQDEAIETKDYDYKRYNKIVNKLVELTGNPKVIIESSLCMFRKLFKSTRYFGYYADRQLEECLATADILEHQYHLNIWSYRALTVPDKFQGERHGWQGVRKELLTKFIKTGEV